MIEGITPDFDMPTILIAGVCIIIVFIYVLISFIMRSVEAEREREVLLKISYKLMLRGLIIILASIFMNVLAGNQFNLTFLKNTIILKSVGKWMFRAFLSLGYMYLFIGIEIAVIIAFKKVNKPTDRGGV